MCYKEFTINIKLFKYKWFKGGRYAYKNTETSHLKVSLPYSALSLFSLSYTFLRSSLWIIIIITIIIIIIICYFYSANYTYRSVAIHIKRTLFKIAYSIFSVFRTLPYAPSPSLRSNKLLSTRGSPLLPPRAEPPISYWHYRHCLRMAPLRIHHDLWYRNLTKFNESALTSLGVLITQQNLLLIFDVRSNIDDN